MHKSSLNINRDIFILMKETADSLGISVSALIKRIIFSFSNHYTPLLIPDNNSVAYQSTCSGWHIFPFSCSDSEYEQLLDIRKVWKLSVSFFVTIGFLFFLQKMDENMSDSKTEKNSYMFSNYIIEKFTEEKSLKINIQWKKREETHKLE